jgi:CheY-like chemotaxis protein
MMMAEIFRLNGATVDTAGGAGEAIARLDAGMRYDVLVSDIGMPDVDGYQLLRALTRRYPERRRDLVAVAASGYAREEDKLSALEAGYDLHVAKPFNFEALIPEIATLIAQRHHGRKR